MWLKAKHQKMLPLHSVRSLHVNEGKTFTELPVSLHISPSHTLSISFFWVNFHKISKLCVVLLSPPFNHQFRILDVTLKLKVIGTGVEGRAHEGRDKNKGGKRLEKKTERQTSLKNLCIR